ncbi:MAG TPA: hypothetical protein VGK67_33770 [Myxococcales bacterium]|jgi:hypothetical protein
MRNALLLVASVALSLQAGCSCLVNPGQEEEGQPCLNGLCLAGYRCESEVCVSVGGPKRDAGGAWRPDAGWPSDDAGTGWQPPESIGHPWSGSPLRDLAPRLAISDDGDVFLAFADSAGAINVRRRQQNAGVWGPLHVLCEAGCSSPLVAAGPDGSAVVAWSTGSTIFASFFKSGLGWPSGWQAPQYAATGDLSDVVTLSDLEMRSQGAALLYRLLRANGTVDLSLAASTGETWLQTGISQGQPATSEGALAIAADAADLAIMTVYSQGHLVRATQVTFTTYAPNFLVGPMVPLSPDFGPGAQPGSVAVSSDGYGSGVAVFAFSGGQGAYAARFANLQWSPAGRLDPGLGAAGPAAAAADLNGNGLVLFRQCYTDCAVWASGYFAYGGLGGAAQISAGVPQLDEPRVALDSAGRALQLWLQNNEVWASEIGELRDPLPFGPPVRISSPTASSFASSPALVYRNGLGYAAWFHTEGALVGARYRAPLR